MSEELVSMPANIALIKYMGKVGGGKNRPANSSLSWTLEHLRSTVKLVENQTDIWQPLPSDFPIAMGEKGQNRFLTHLDFLRKEFGGLQKFVVNSANNFPADCGIASSASSFAALTTAVIERLAPEVPLTKRAYLSSLGSGSSCRSFMPGWVIWSGDTITPMNSPFQNLQHMVVIVADQKKAVTSSEAHSRVQSSLLMNDRVLRAEVRLRAFMEAADEADWSEMYTIAWAEFWDMHAMFHTANPAFSYFQPASITLLDEVQNYWRDHKDGPLVTMDAGPNVHFLWRENQLHEAMRYFQSYIKGRFSCLTNIPEIGFAIL